MVKVNEIKFNLSGRKFVIQRITAGWDGIRLYELKERDNGQWRSELASSTTAYGVENPAFYFMERILGHKPTNGDCIEMLLMLKLMDMN